MSAFIVMDGTSAPEKMRAFTFPVYVAEIPKNRLPVMKKSVRGIPVFRAEYISLAFFPIVTKIKKTENLVFAHQAMQRHFFDWPIHNSLLR